MSESQNHRAEMDYVQKSQSEIIAVTTSIVDAFEGIRRAAHDSVSLSKTNSLALAEIHKAIAKIYELTSEITKCL